MIGPRGAKLQSYFMEEISPFPLSSCKVDFEVIAKIILLESGSDQFATWREG